jgi:hypothetical protein
MKEMGMNNNRKPILLLLSDTITYLNGETNDEDLMTCTFLKETDCSTSGRELRN